jgi:hypothetical protein
MLALTDEPLNLIEDLNDNNWKKAIDIEFDSLEKNRT